MTERPRRIATLMAKAKRWEKAFLTALAERGVVSRAAEAAGINRGTAYRHKEASPEFSLAWDAAMEDATDVAEEEAFRRAVEGILEPVFYAGEEVATIRKYSDQLLVFLLKARRYRSQVEVTGADRGPIEFKDVSATDELEQEMARIAATKAQVEEAIAANGHPVETP